MRKYRKDIRTSCYRRKCWQKQLMRNLQRSVLFNIYYYIKELERAKNISFNNSKEHYFIEPYHYYGSNIWIAVFDISGVIYTIKENWDVAKEKVIEKAREEAHWVKVLGYWSFF